MIRTDVRGSELIICFLQGCSAPGLSISKVLKTIKTKKVGGFVANVMEATLTREYMATHSYKGQKGKNGQTKPKLDPQYIASLIGQFLLL
jgi:hypothetical protein